MVCPFPIRPLRNPGIKMIPRLQNIPAFEGSRGPNLLQAVEKRSQRFGDTGFFPFPRWSARAGDDGQLVRHDGHIFDKRGIRIPLIRFQDHDVEAARPQNIDIGVVLTQRFFIIGRSQICAGNSPDKIAAGFPDDGMEKHLRSSAA